MNLVDWLYPARRRVERERDERRRKAFFAANPQYACNMWSQKLPADYVLRPRMLEVTDETVTYEYEGGGTLTFVKTRD